MKRFICPTILLIGCSVAAHAATMEAVTNGGFEAGNTGFTSEFIDLSPGLAFNAGTRSVTDPLTNYFGVDVYEGDWMLTAVTPEESAGEVVLWEQEIWLEAGVFYDYSLKFVNAESNNQIRLSNRFEGVEFSIFSSLPSEDIWSGGFSSFVAIATSGNYTVSIVDVSTIASVSYAVDNISLSYDAPVAVVPLPATLPLALFGIGILGAFRKFPTLRSIKGSLNKAQPA